MDKLLKKFEGCYKYTGPRIRKQDGLSDFDDYVKITSGITKFSTKNELGVHSVDKSNALTVDHDTDTYNTYRLSEENSAVGGGYAGYKTYMPSDNKIVAEETICCRGCRTSAREIELNRDKLIFIYCTDIRNRKCDKSWSRNISRCADKYLGSNMARFIDRYFRDYDDVQCEKLMKYDVYEEWIRIDCESIQD